MNIRGHLGPMVGKETLRVLHAEDSDDCAILVQRALRLAGFCQPLVRFRDGEEAIDHLARVHPEARPHVILLDLHMPIKNGFDVLEWVRQQASYAMVPVLMLTSSEEPADIQRAETLGATKFLKKDGTFREVIRTLEHFLEDTASLEEPHWARMLVGHQG